MFCICGPGPRFGCSVTWERCTRQLRHPGLLPYQPLKHARSRCLDQFGAWVNSLLVPCDLTLIQISLVSRQPLVERQTDIYHAFHHLDMHSHGVGVGGCRHRFGGRAHSVTDLPCQQRLNRIGTKLAGRSLKVSLFWVGARGAFANLITKHS
jgi:hypothetical protein